VSTEVINAPELPLFVDRPDLTARVLHELRNYAEEWAKIELVPYRAYGFRLYRNHSQLTMHLDKMQTHIVSFILHIDSSEDAEPWPIFIEDLHGRTHEVILTPGDILFYESSKLFHGRPRRLNGSWYSSIFVHYYPRCVRTYLCGLVLSFPCS
jgi:prolyl 4-hydroxylase